MTGRDIDYHPDLEEVLRDIARDPKAKLLRIPSSGDLVRMMREEPVGVHAPGLTKAERHLLRVHREEVAKLLRERCWIEFHSDSRTQVRWSSWISPTKNVSVRSVGQWAAQVQRVAAVGEDIPGADIDALSQCLGNSGASIDISQVARKAYALSPRSESILYGALDSYERGHLQTARAGCEAVLASNPPALLKSYCWEMLATIHCASKEYHRALSDSQQAVSSLESRVLPAVGWLATSLMTGDMAAIADSARFLDAALPPDHHYLSEYESFLRLIKEREPSLVPQSVAATGRRLVDDLGSTSRRVVHALVA